MNIFACDQNPTIAARSLPNKLICKMSLETAQILCTVLHQRGYENLPYKPTHRNHPVMKWCNESDGNIQWLIQHGLALCDEYTRRYQKTHKSRLVIEFVASLQNFSGPLTPFVQCMPDEFKQEDPVLAYRRYLVEKKSHYAEFKAPGARPEWW